MEVMRNPKLRRRKKPQERIEVRKKEGMMMDGNNHSHHHSPLTKKNRLNSLSKHLLFLLLGLLGRLISLRVDTLLSPLASSLGAGTSGIHLLLDRTLTGSLGLGLVNLLLRNKNRSVIKCFTYRCRSRKVVVA